MADISSVHKCQHRLRNRCLWRQQRDLLKQRRRRKKSREETVDIPAVKRLLRELIAPVKVCLINSVCLSLHWKDRPLSWMFLFERDSHLPNAKLAIFWNILSWHLSFVVGTRRKSRSKSRADTEKVASDFNSKSCSSSTQNTSSSGWRTSSSDGRSTSSSGENFGAAICTNSSSSNETRSRQNADSTGSLAVASSSSLTRINETMRWDFTECDDPAEEEERLKIYKLHRRKRYMDFLHKRTGGEPQSSFYA